MPRRHSRSRWLVVMLAVAAAAGGSYAAIRSSTDDDGPALPPEKEARKANVMRLRSSLPRDSAAKLEYVKSARPPTARPEPLPPTGILQLRQAPLPWGLYDIENRWQAMQGSTLLQVFAGALKSDPDAGVVVVRRLVYPSGRAEAIRVRRPQGGVGRLRIAKANGNRLTMTAGNRSLLFDVDQEAFVAP